MKGGDCLLVSMYLLVTVCLLLIDIENLLTGEDKDEMNSSALHIMVWTPCI